MGNAITAVSALPAKQRKLRFAAVNAGQLIFELSNPYDGEVAVGENGFPVSREKGHGKGTQSVADFVKKCGGELAYEITDGIFKVRLMV